MNVIWIILAIFLIGGIVGGVVAGMGGGGGGGPGGGPGAPTNQFSEEQANGAQEAKSVTRGGNTLRFTYTHSALKDSAVGSTAETILGSILTGLNGNFNFTVHVGTFTDGTLGTYTNNRIELGMHARKAGLWKNNAVNADVPLMTTVLIHEILHGLGMNRNAYFGNIMNSTYQRMTEALVDGVVPDTYATPCPIEDDGGAGSVNSHFEEGLDIYSDNGNATGYVYPYEIMTPASNLNLGGATFITP